MPRTSQTSPCAVNNGSYDVKHVLGTVDVEEDGSCYFECPSRVPVYFQMLDERGRMVQNMRSWTMVLPGETFACLGCHEHKSGSPLPTPPSTALRRKPLPLEPFYGPPRGFSFAREIQPILDRHCTRCHNDRSRLPWRFFGRLTTAALAA